MTAYQNFVANLNKYIIEQATSTSRKDKILMRNNIHVKNAIILLGEKCFNTHITNVIDWAFEDTQKKEEDFNYFYGYVGNSFHKAFRQYDVSDRLYPQTYKTYGVGFSTGEVLDLEYSLDGLVDSINWTAYSLNSNFWDIIHQYSVTQYDAKVAK